MLFTGLVITIVLGAAITLCLSRQLKLIELAGLAFPVGMGAQTFFMVWLDLFGLRLTSTSVLTTSLLLIIGAAVYLYFRRGELAAWLRYISAFNFPEINLLWGLCLLAILAMTVMNVAKTMYFPTFDVDSVRGYDLFGFAIAREGTLKGLSLFTDVNYYAEAHGPGSYITYTPLTQLSYAYVYMLGAKLSKIVNVLFFISLALAFYGITSRFASHTLTALVSFFMLLTPEMLGFSSMSGTNFIHAVYASLGILYFIAWYYKKIPAFLWLSAVLLVLNNWTRSEGMAFIGAACCLLLWHSLRTKSYKQLIYFSAACLLPFIFWTIFLKINDMQSVQVFIFKPFWDGEKMSLIFREVWALFNSSLFYGLTFVLFLIVLLSNAWNMYKKGDQLVLLAAILLALVFYTIMVYQIDYLWDSLLNVLQYSYKRFLFSFVPLLWFYIAANQNVRRLFEKIDRFIFNT